MPRLSFIVPTYKPKLDVFEKCLRSLREQALVDWEAIIVFDGADKNAEDVVDKVFGPDSRVRVMVREHAGAQAARNAGGAEAKGDFLCFFDSDCVLEPGASKMWVEQFDKRPEVGFIYSGYKFFGEKYAIDSQPWDPWELRIRNFVSGCFPMRRELYPGWTDGLKSLQDWDMWLSLLEKAEGMGWDLTKIGLFARGYAFATAMPTPDSISGQGCTAEAWPERFRAVKTLHNLPDRKVCVSSLNYRHDGVALAKMLDADYLDVPNDKPHSYKTIIQIGFSLGANSEKHAAIFQDKGVKKVLFWTGDNINEIYHSVSFQQIDAMSQLLNESVVQYCEDREAQRLLKRAGFNAEVRALPIGKPNLLPKSEERKWALDISGQYSPLVSVIAQSLPDIDLEVIGPASRLSDYRGLIHFFPDRTLSASVKRAHLTGRHVISNIQKPFCGFVDDKWDPEKFVVQVVEKVRALTDAETDPEAPTMYENDAAALREEVCA